MNSGAWCAGDDSRVADDMDHCRSRKNDDYYGTSDNDGASANMDWDVFSTNANDNPLLHNWSGAFIRYCDGHSFSGDVEAQQPNGAYYRGHRILRGVLRHLRDYHGLSDATDVMITGCSAGGLAAILHADYIRDWILNINPTARIGVMVDSGIFLDVNEG